QSHEGHLSTNGRGQCPLPIGKVGGRHPPPATATSLLLLLLGRLLLLRHDRSHLLRAATCDHVTAALLLLLLGRLLLRHGVVHLPSFSVISSPSLRDADARPARGPARSRG